MAKEKMLAVVERMETIVDRFYGQELQRELARLRQALESDNDFEVAEAISETIEGCGTATSELRSLNYLLDDFEQLQTEIQSQLNAAVDEFENAE